MYKNLRLSGAQFGITFAQVRLLSNSRTALEAGEFARDHGKFDLFHEQVFQSYFTENRDIGNLDVIMEIAKDCGLNSDELKQALRGKKYLPRLKKISLEAHKNNINSAPTFIIENKLAIIGAQPTEVFRDALKKFQ